MSTFLFLDFELDVSRRSLAHRGQPVKIGSRALDILAVLASRQGKLVSSSEILEAVWPNSLSAENSLRVTLGAVRKALAVADAGTLIQTVAGRGYILSATVRKKEPAVHPVQLQTLNSGNLPGKARDVIGRESFVARSLELRQSHVMTIVGTGGIGKTTVALEIAHLLKDEHEAVYFLDLAALGSAAAIAPSLASLLGLSVYGDDPLPGIVAALTQRKVLLVFDNCEHVIAEAARIIEGIARTCPDVMVLSTSREPLSIHGETIRRLGSLDVPDEDEVSAQAMQRSAVALFIARMEQSFEMGAPIRREQMDIVTAIVRKLEGIPLAIEFAASRVVDLGLEQLLASLDQPLTVLRRGRRTAPRRQQTLQATLDWSYGFLTENERSVLQSLSVFAYSFSREGALAVCTTAVGQEEAEDAIWGLQSKSLLSRSESGRALRLLDTTREYAAIKLAATGRRGNVRLAHASLLLVRMREAELQWDKLQTVEWLNGYGILIHDLRLALTFCEETGHTRLFHELLANSGTLWTQLGLMNEQFRHIEKAVRVFDHEPSTDALLETQLRSAYGSIAYNVQSVDGDTEARRQFELAARSARSLNDPTRLLRAGSGVCALLTTQGRYHAANAVALELQRDLGEAAEPAVNRILAHNSHYLGAHDDAYKYAMRALRANGLAVRGTLTSGANFGQKTLSLMVMAKTAYIRGQIDTSLEHLDELTSDILLVDHPISTCLGLAVGACPIYFGLGEMELGHRFLNTLRDISTRHSLFRWREWVEGYEYAVGAGDDDNESAVACLRHGGNGPRLENVVALAGKKAGPELIDLALSGEAGWCHAELVRLKGEIMLDGGDSGGRGLLLDAYRIAVDQSALTWQLKCASSLARYGSHHTRNADRERVERTLDGFSGPPSKVDVKAAEATLKLLSAEQQEA
ncbi:winged helix-turn-helix domain-containing protein [Neorhizobium sp. BT27B]|uniref:ATP-binding protein n=1 Tax=Neorhizobium sp. BT27B TaxID=3142625 RepID=UPI003D289BCB